MLTLYPPLNPTMSLLDAIGRAFHWLWPRAKELVDGKPAKHEDGISERLVALVKDTARDAIRGVQGEVKALRELVETQKRQIRRLKRAEKFNRLRRHELATHAQKLQGKYDLQSIEIAELKKINYDQQLEINRLLGLLGQPVIHRPVPPQLPLLPPAAESSD